MSYLSETFGYEDTGWSPFPGLGVLERPPKIIAKAGEDTAAVWNSFYFEDTETSKNHEYGNAVWTFLDFCWQEGPRTLVDIKTEHIENWEEELDHANAGYYAISIQMSAIRRFFQACVQAGLMSSSPFSARALGVHVP